MFAKLLTCVALTAAFAIESHAIIYHYDNLDSKKKVCRLKSWSGTQPTSGKINIPSSYTHTDGKDYKVTSIAPDALNGLTTVTEINIPASVTVIGKSNSTTQTDIAVCNFYDCPQLKKFVVDSSNTAFETSAEGILFLKGGEKVLKVPAKVTTDGEGRLTFSSTNTLICDDAFHGNTTVQILAINTYASINRNGGLNHALNLRKYEVKGNQGWLTKSGGLLIDAETRAVSWPPALETDEVRVPSTVEIIADYAFANTRVGRVKMSAVERIYKGAFRNSAIKDVTLPGSVAEILQGAFENCQQLTSISLESVDLKLPDRFARNCGKLSKVTTQNPIYRLGESAFKDCASLVEFPFSGYTRCEDDSIFYGCGFTEVVYDDEPTYDLCTYSPQTFGACRNLQRIDASNMATTPDLIYAIGPDFAPLCPNLKEMCFADFSSFWSNGNMATPPVFGYECALEKIVLHTFWNDESNRFCYSPTHGVTEFYPDVFVAVTANSDVDATGWNRWPVKDLFTSGNGASVHPRFYCDAYAPGQDYVVPAARYYVAGGTVSNYSRAVEAGCQVEEMFEVSFEKSGDRMKVSVGEGALTGNMTPRSIRIRFDDEAYTSTSFPGYVTSSKPMSQISKVRIAYDIDNVEMVTEYPSTHWTGSGVSQLPDEQEDMDCRVVDGVLTFGANVGSFSLYSMAGREILSGRGDRADVSNVPAGIYVLMIHDTGRSIKIRI